MRDVKRRTRAPNLHGRDSPVWLRLFIITALLLMALMLGACQPAETATPTEVPPTDVPPTEVPPTEVPPEPTEVPPTPTEVPPTPTPLPDQSMQLAAWEASPHGNTYDLGKGPNTYCSRCHSPQNWDPESKPGPPPTCITCKFPTDEEVRESPFMDFVEEEDWVGITCDSCHIVENGVVTEGNAWLNTLTGEYEAISTPNQLCTKCHLEAPTVDHEVYLGGSAHKNWAGNLTDEHRPDVCTDCHDPHTQQPLQCEGCHEDPPALHADVTGFVVMYEAVTCMACHDALGLDVGPHPDEEMGGIWVTQETTVGRGGPVTAFVLSHSPQKDVACDRCHYEGNPAELTVLTATGEIPSEEEEGGPPP